MGCLAEQPLLSSGGREAVQRLKTTESLEERGGALQVAFVAGVTRGEVVVRCHLCITLAPIGDFQGCAERCGTHAAPAHHALHSLLILCGNVSGASRGFQTGNGRDPSGSSSKNGLHSLHESLRQRGFITRAFAYAMQRLRILDIQSFSIVAIALLHGWLRPVRGDLRSGRRRCGGLFRCCRAPSTGLALSPGRRFLALGASSLLLGLIHPRVITRLRWWFHVGLSLLNGRGRIC
mmetsp:Transcript_73765/g.159664  ORF Transcript_73765/g.159664 Transcript_73765/m.159664 type:complete len:235 (+) Transcript_73765:1500-2204(+)